MYTLEDDIRELSLHDKETINKMHEWVRAQINYKAKSFIQYENTLEKSMELIQGLYNEDTIVELFIAPTQFGKTSTIFWTAYHLMTHVDMRYFVPYPFIFIMSGLNSNAWKNQTKNRVLPCMMENVWHNKDIGNSENITRLKDAIMSEFNTLIIIDEVHVGTKLNHVLFKTLLGFHPESNTRHVTQTELFQFLDSKHVKFLLVSATPDSIKETMEQHWCSQHYKVVISHPDSVPTYVWHKDFMEHERVKQSYGSLLKNTKDGKSFAKEIAESISQYSRPLYHMIRLPAETKKSEINSSKNHLDSCIKKMNVDVDIVLWNCKNTIQDYFKSKNYKIFENDELNNPLRMNKMTNEQILKEKPIRHTIFILKELFRISQTLPIENVGLLVDREVKTPCDSTLSQSLIGRACGHNKHQFINQILIYTNIKSVMRYIQLWDNGFDFGKVPDYKGNGLETTKAGRIVKSCGTMMGDKVKRKVVRQRMEMEEDENQDDTQERLQKVKNAYQKSNTIVHKILRLYIENDFEDLSLSVLKSASKKEKIDIGHYSIWNSKHGRYKIIEKNNDMWALRPVIREYLNL